MIFTTRLKIWTLFSHACIVIGVGHGVATFGIAELFWFLALFNGEFSLAPFPLLCLAGQMASAYSIRFKHSLTGKSLHVGGLCFLWASVIEFAYQIRNDHYDAMPMWFCLPFAICTFWTLTGGYIQLLWQKIDAKL